MNDDSVQKPLRPSVGGDLRPRPSSAIPSNTAFESSTTSKFGPEGSGGEDFFQEQDTDFIEGSEVDNYAQELSKIKAGLDDVSKYVRIIPSVLKKVRETSESLPSDLQSTLGELGKVNSQVRDLSGKLDQIFRDITCALESNRSLIAPTIEKPFGQVVKQLAEIHEKMSLVSQSVEGHWDETRKLLQNIANSSERDVSRRMETLSRYFQNLIYQFSVNFAKRSAPDEEPQVAKLRKIGDALQKIRSLGENLEPLIKGSFGEIESKLPRSPDWKRLRDEVVRILPSPGKEMSEFISRSARLNVETILANEGEHVLSIDTTFLADPASACLRFFEQEARKRIAEELQSLKSQPVDNPSGYIEKLQSSGVLFIRELDARAKRNEIDQALMEPPILEILDALNLTEIAVNPGETDFNHREHRELERRASPRYRPRTVLEVVVRGFMRKDRTHTWPADVVVADVERV